ncbi:MAG: pantoate--beta-alanine ligase, partial [Candidatus Latescibacteria bacterium]|nr:pantoate--beta-alanine ligase [Candidatus Latescibacterota bacterium]
MGVDVIRTVGEMHHAADVMRQSGQKIGLVPTMGFLHKGHLSLVEHALEVTDRVVVSIFVNPIQFGPSEDLDAYPRDLDRDLKLISDLGAHIAYVPSVEEMYPEGFVTSVAVTDLTANLCGRARPGHFEGVTTVVAKLFATVKPHV